MKQWFSVLMIGAFVVACNTGNESSSAEEKQENGTTPYAVYGDTITPDSAFSASEVIELLKMRDSVYVKVTGLIDEVCQKKGCWMDLTVNDSTYITVRFVDYSFFVPKDAAGKIAIAEGWVKVDTLSVEELRHYAADGGKSKEEIEAITQPELSYEMMAHGVLIK